MFNLLRNENMKIYRRLRTWIMVALLMMGIVLGGLAQKYGGRPPEAQDWKQQLTEQNQNLQKQLAEAQVPDSVKRSMEVEIKKNEYALANDISPHRTTGWKFAENMTPMIQLVTIFTVIIAGDSLASEFSWGTIKLLLIRPVNRTKILISKYLSTLGFALLLLAILFVWSVLVGGVLFGFAGIDQPYIYADLAGNIHERSMLQNVLVSYSLACVSLLMIVTFAFMISAMFRSSSLAIGLSIFLLFTGTTAVQILSRYSWAKYILFANLDLRQYLEGTPMIKGMTMGFSLTMLAVYFVVFHLAAWLLFTKRDVAA